MTIDLTLFFIFSNVQYYGDTALIDRRIPFEFLFSPK